MTSRKPRGARVPVEGVALLALALHEAATNWSSVGPRIDGSEIIYDFETQRRDLSLLTMFASSALSEMDWVIVRALDERPEDLAAIFPEVEPYQREAILHALAAEEGCSELRSPPISRSPLRSVG